MNEVKGLIAGFALCAASVSFAGLYGDTPDSKHAWCVHDVNRPNPVKVTPAREAGQPPSDAVVLFDGTEDALAKNWCDRSGLPTKWVYDAEEGAFGLKLHAEAGKFKTGAGPIFTKAKFGDCQLHIEFKYPADLSGKGQMRGNSGVFLMGNYEIQVMESFGTDPADMKDPNYADGQCGSVYAENPPLVNANRRPGEWQSYDIVFHQPVWEGSALRHPGSITLFHNGILVQDHWEMEGLTTHCRRRPLAPHDKVGPLQLQDHGCPILFRNVWYRPLASRWDNKTHSAMSADSSEVMRLRRETAVRVLEKALRETGGGKDNGWSVGRLLEVFAYDRENAEAKAAFERCAGGFRARLAKMDAAAKDRNKDEILYAKRAYDVLIRNKVTDGNSETCKAIRSVVEQRGWK